MAVAPGDDLVWIAERAGRVLRVDMERGEAVETILDITAETEAAGERGLLGIAVTDRWLFANFTDLEGDTRVDAFERDGTGLSGRRRTILFQPQPFRNHNGGDLAVGPDGLLYVGFGDGGSGGDPLDAGQNPTTWLGAVLRIEPTPDGTEPYAVPADNPFAGDDQSPAGRAEIFLTGVRNPWRFSFDRATGDLWIGDVGQDRYEEVTLLLAANGGGLGANLGWRLREGLHSYAGDEPSGHADPVWEYSQDDGLQRHRRIRVPGHGHRGPLRRLRLRRLLHIPPVGAADLHRRSRVPRPGGRGAWGARWRRLARTRRVSCTRCRSTAKSPGSSENEPAPGAKPAVGRSVRLTGAERLAWQPSRELHGTLAAQSGMATRMRSDAAAGRRYPRLL